MNLNTAPDFANPEPQLNFRFGADESRPANRHWILVGKRQVLLDLVRNPRAKRYVLKVTAHANARVTIPRGGSWIEAIRFVQKHIPWLERQLLMIQSRPRGPQPWLAGANILFRGEAVRLETVEADGGRWVRFGTEQFLFEFGDHDLRPAVESYLRRLATKELPRRVADLAAVYSFRVDRVSVRNQRSRWGSCSPRGVISLNWRLIQTPEFVRDYIILHELAHLREMNHSRRFWREVERICPNFADAEKWLKKYPELLR